MNDLSRGNLNLCIRMLLVMHEGLYHSLQRFKQPLALDLDVFEIWFFL